MRPLLAGLGAALALWLTRPEYVDHWDEVQLALGVLDFDLSRHQPHPPGYPGVIALGRAWLPLLGDPLEALRASSALAMGLWVALVSAQLPEDKPAPLTLLLTLCVAALPVLSPLLGYQGRSGLGYAWEALAWTGFALLMAKSRTLEDRSRGALGLGALAGLIGVLRPNLSLWAGALFLLQRPPAPRALAFAAGWVLGAVAWALPLLYAAGGPEAWWAASEIVLGNIGGRSLIHADASGWLRRLTMPGQLALAVGPLLLLTPHLRRRTGGLGALIQAALLAFLFHLALIHDTSSYLSAPAACVAAWLLLQAGAWAQSWRRAALVSLLVLSTALLPAWPLFERSTPPPGAAHDALMEALLSLIHESPPNETLILTTTPGWRLGLRHLGWHAPENTVLQLSVDAGFSVVSPERPYLGMQGRQLQTFGPSELELQELLGAPPARVLLVGPSEGFVQATCAPQRLHEHVLEVPGALGLSQGQLRCR